MIAEGADLIGQLAEAVKPPGEADRAMTASATLTQAWLVQIPMPPTMDFPTRDGSGRSALEHLVADKALIDAAQGFHKSLKHALQPADDFGEIIQ